MSEQGTLGLDPGAKTPGVLSPLSDEPDYPAILLEMAELVETELVKAEVPAPQAAALAETMAEHMRERYGGQNIYLPKGEVARAKRRRAAMWADFNGSNYREIARKYGMSLQYAYQCIRLARAEHLARTQGDLFGSQG
jgi:Mor family transcriptional regulator